MPDPHPRGPSAEVEAALRAAIEAAIPSASAQITGAGGHYSIAVTSPAFAGKSTLERQRLVYGAIGHLMKGADAPVHAIDELTTKAP